MSYITFILRDGSYQSVAIDAHPNAMEAAVENDIPGIDAACGGYCSCATCMVLVETGGERLQPPAADETAMLAKARKRVPRDARLACQIPLSPALDGLVLRIPERP